MNEHKSSGVCREPGFRDRLPQSEMELDLDTVSSSHLPPIGDGINEGGE